MIERNRVDQLQSVERAPDILHHERLSAYVGDRFTKFQASITARPDWGWILSWKWYRKDWLKWMPPSKIIPRKKSGTLYIDHHSSDMLFKCWSALMKAYRSALLTIHSFENVRSSKKIAMPPSNNDYVGRNPSAILYDKVVGYVYAVVAKKDVVFYQEMPKISKPSGEQMPKTRVRVAFLTQSYKNAVNEYVKLLES
jgi:hypothetical protein